MLTPLHSSPTSSISMNITSYHVPKRAHPPGRIMPLAAMATTQKDNRDSAKRVAVIGAGVSGLAAAYKLKSQGMSVTLFEADNRTGGKIRTVKKDGLIWDEGANTMTESEIEVTRLLDDLGLRDKLQLPLSQNKRYVARNGTPLMLPSGPVSLIGSEVLSTQAKLRLFMEPFCWNKGSKAKVLDENAWESVGDFFQRHFGKELVDYLLDPFLAGTCGGDPESVSMKHTFPDLWKTEKRFGSIILGTIQSRLASKKDTGKEPKFSPRQRGSFSFKGGMQTLVDTISRQLNEDELKLQAKVLSLSYGGDQLSTLGDWSVSYHSNSPQNQSFDAVVMTAPVADVKQMKISKRGKPFSLSFLPDVYVLPVSIFITAFKKSDVKKPLEGFGVLIPSKEQKNGLRTLGTLFSSAMFPDRAPSDVHLYTTFIGGSRSPELAKASTDELKQVVSSDLRQLLGAEGEPTFVHHCFWNKAFPLYGKNYDSVLSAINKMEQDLPGLFYAGNHKDGLSVGKALGSGYRAAENVITYLDSIPEGKKVKAYSSA